MTVTRAPIAYVKNTGDRPRYYANAHDKDTVVIAPVDMDIVDLRGLPTSLDEEGCVMVPHTSAVTDWTDHAQISAVHIPEIVALLKAQTGCDHVSVSPRGILRFSEKSGRTGSTDNSHPARFAHVDVSAATGETFRAQAAPAGKALTRSAQYNVWRAVSGAPQDVSLALCDYRSVQGPELVKADAIFDPPGGAAEFSFEGYVVTHDPAHRWFWFSDLQPTEAIIFKTSESDPAIAQCIPHVAFDNPNAPDDAPPRVSIEMRATCYWLGAE